MKPEIVQKFENILWACSPKSWIFKSTYYQNMLFVSILVEISDGQFKKLHRSFSATEIKLIKNIEETAKFIMDRIKQEIAE